MGDSLHFNLTFNRIENCYDSHVHWRATGERLRRLDLSQLKAAEDISSLKIRDEYFRSDWIVGFGWDHHKWSGQALPSRKILDQLFPNRPVAFSRADGHAVWVNSEALKRAGLFYKSPEVPDGSRIPLDDSGFPSGVLFENASQAIRKIIPAFDSPQMKACLKAGAEIFNQAGFTHIRDLSGNLLQWNASCEMEDQKQLTLHVDQFFGVESGRSFHEVLREALYARKSRRLLLNAAGIKVFLDGSLGSETAFLSQNYLSGSGRGLCLLERFTLKEMFIETWSAGLDLAVHVLGDEAAHMVAGIARELWDRGENGILHLEHAELCRPETVKLLDPKRTVVHMQPCHWLTDRNWLLAKIGPKLFQFAFPWRQFESSGIPVFFGSDSPIEPAVIANNWLAVKDAEASGIPIFANEFVRLHSRPKRDLRVQGVTEFSDGAITKVTLGDQVVFQPH